MRKIESMSDEKQLYVGGQIDWDGLMYQWACLPNLQ